MNTFSLPCQQHNVLITSLLSRDQPLLSWFWKSSLSQMFSMISMNSTHGAYKKSVLHFFLLNTECLSDNVQQESV